METQEVELILDKNGRVKIHVNGAKGNSCLEITRELEELLGGEVISREMTSESLEMGNPIDQPLQIKQGNRKK